MKLFNTLETTFDSYDSTVKSYLSKVFNTLGLQYTSSQIFGAIFDGIKGIMQNIMVYIEDAFTEQNIDTATRRKSIYSLAKQSGYEPVYGYAATGTILIKMYANTSTESSSTKIYLKNHSIIQDANTGYEYVIIMPTNNYVFDITKPLVTHEFKVVQGEYKTHTYTATGKNLETVSIDGLSLWDKDYLEVYVDNEKYTAVTNLYDMSHNGKEYIVSVGYDNSFNIQFGNDEYGNRLTSGQNVTINYLAHNGTYGNITSSQATNFKFTSNGTDGLGNIVNLNDFLSISLQNCISGGVNADSIELVRSMIGYTSRSLVLASEDNYMLFLSRFSFIGHINCWSEENSMTICVSALSNAYDNITDKEDYFKLEPSSLLLTDTQKELIQTALENSKKTFAGVTLKFKDPVIRKYAIICYIKVETTYNRETVKVNVLNAIASYFMNLTSDTSFIAKSDIIQTAINSDSNIVAFDCTIISDTAEKCYRDGYYEKYTLKYINNTFDYVTTRVIYDSSNTPGLDLYGNISLDSKLEIPMLLGSIYFADKSKTYNSSKSTNTSINIEPVQFVFI